MGSRMRQSVLSIVRQCVLFMGLATSALAHSGGRLYEAVELSDEDLRIIDLHDQSVQDWWDVVGPPSVEATDFEDFFEKPLDPADSYFRVWLAWHDATNRIYGAVERSDDLYTGGREARVELMIDGDHSGGPFLDWTLEERERRLYNNSQAQAFALRGESYESRPSVELQFEDYPDTWFAELPFADVGGGHSGESPSVITTEFHVTAFDRLTWNSRDLTQVSELHPGKVLGFDLIIEDLEPGPTDRDRQWYLHDGEMPIYGDLASGLVDLVLVPRDARSTRIRSTSWASLKVLLRP